MINIDNSLAFIEDYKLALISLASVTGVLILAKRYFNGGYFYDNQTRLDGKTVIITGSNTGNII
jgi:hypothetical protein